MLIVTGVDVNAGVGVESISAVGLINGVCVGIIFVGVFVFTSIVGGNVGEANGIGVGVGTGKLLYANVNTTPEATKLTMLNKNEVSERVRYPRRS